MINMFMDRNTPLIEWDPECYEFIPNTEKYSYAFLWCILILVPIMLFVKPCYYGCCKAHPHHEKEGS